MGLESCCVLSANLLSESGWELYGSTNHFDGSFVSNGG